MAPFIRVRAAGRAALVFVLTRALALGCESPDDVAAPLIPAEAGVRAARTLDADPNRTGDAQVIDFLLAENVAAIGRARLGVAKAASKSTRAIASAMLADHEAMRDDLVALGRQKGLEPLESSAGNELRADATDVEAELARRTGVSFDRRYLEEETFAHLRAMAAIDRSVAPMAVDSDLVRAVARARDHAVSHRQNATDVLRAVRAEAGAATVESTSSSGQVSSSDGGTGDATAFGDAS